MTPNEAAQILEALARGIDPETGEVLPEDGPLNSTHVVRALIIGAKSLAMSTAPQKPKRELPDGREHAWQPWTKEEETKLLDAFDGGTTIEELAVIHKRKVGGITARLMKLGRLDQTGRADGDA